MRCDLLSCMHVSSTNVSPYWMVTWALVWTLFALSEHFASLFVKAPSAHFPSGEAVPVPVNAFPVAMSCQCILRHGENIFRVAVSGGAVPVGAFCVAVSGGALPVRAFCVTRSGNAALVSAFRVTVSGNALPVSAFRVTVSGNAVPVIAFCVTMCGNASPGNPVPAFVL